MYNIGELIINSLIPLSFVIFLGWIAGFRKIVDTKHIYTLSTYVMSFSFPCLLFAKTVITDIHKLINFRFIIGFAIGLMGMYIFVLLVNRFVMKKPLNQATQLAFVCSFPNMAFMGIPMFSTLFHSDALISIVIGNIITSVIMIPITVIILENTGANRTGSPIGLWHMIFEVFKKPLVISQMLSILFVVSGLHMPKLVISSMDLIGTTTSGVSLFTLGMIMSAKRVSFSWSMVTNVCLKNIVHPCIMLLIVYVFGIEGNWAREAVLLCAMPTAVITAMFALKYDVLPLETGSSAVIGTVVSLITLSVFMVIVGM